MLREPSQAHSPGLGILPSVPSVRCRADVEERHSRQTNRGREQPHHNVPAAVVHTRQFHVSVREKPLREQLPRQAEGMRTIENCHLLAPHRHLIRSQRFARMLFDHPQRLMHLVQRRMFSAGPLEDRESRPLMGREILQAAVPLEESLPRCVPAGR
ncbi:hypothetical protein CURTO8I2_70347 [Curtobacterium sp. 8I-2]|nr:hypothetical protein CURTO8I2_70347 [Curtobacterium sp. 8I-2]